LGFSRKSRFKWVFVQCLIVIILAQGVAFFASNHFFDRIFDYAIERAFIAEDEEESTIFGDTATLADGITAETEFEQEPLAIPLAMAASSILLLCAAAGLAHGMSRRRGAHSATA
jgi:hypothetical protein